MRPKQSAVKWSLRSMPIPAADRTSKASKHGQVWDTGQLQDEFQVLGFMAPFVVARRRSDGVRGSLMFQNDPRFYYSFSPE